MSRLSIPSRDAAPEASRDWLNQIHKQLGVVPSFFRLVGSSPAALKGYMALSTSLGQSVDVRLRERIGIAVAQANGCDYCLSSHNYRALNLAKIGPDEISRNREGLSNDATAEAAMRFAMAVVDRRGRVSDGDISAVRSAGFTDPQIVEIVALVALNLFTNYLNEVAQTEIDFPIVRAADPA